ncbi:hypothetical protein CBR_g78869 [Chara braunii]|uniref:Inositol polyphosphate-related phosphatase domain-containing protein n=1 Tax=Chara braunii TaxID=69332 RepID=A0A388KAK2_CHABU|nr:hypothetical protein CBR_g78869 [Chara braunii]|eukprot:GBG67088.1 hypothetical protein CBR_g78869 [Chara braunii]
MLNQFHHLFWMGDLNYRLGYPTEADEGYPTTPRKSVFNEVVEKIKLKSFKDLLSNDELTKERKAGQVFADFKEGEINFAPTFKMVRGEEDQYMEKRLPAWCDRILWRSLSGCKANLAQLYSAPSVKTSDHKPVAAKFHLNVSALPTDDEVDGSKPQYKLRLLSLSARGLKKGDVMGLSDPLWSLLAIIPKERVTLCAIRRVGIPMRSDAVPEMDLPAIELKTSSLERLEREHVYLKVRDSDLIVDNDTLGHGVMSLASAVAAYRSKLRHSTIPQHPVHFQINLSHSGIAEGQLQGQMELQKVSRRGSIGVRNVVLLRRLIPSLGVRSGSGSAAERTHILKQAT